MDILIPDLYFYDVKYRLILSKKIYRKIHEEMISFQQNFLELIFFLIEPDPEADDDKLLIVDEPTNYIEAISNIDLDKWLKVMKCEMNFMSTNQV